MKRLNTGMDNWTYRPWHLNTCSFRLICKPKWSFHLQIQIRDFFPSFLEKYDHPQHPAFELKLIDWLIAVTIKLIDWLIAIRSNSQTHKKYLNPTFLSKNPQMDNKETFGGMFQSLKAIALHIFLSSAWTSSTTSSALLSFGPIYLMLIIIKMPRPLWHFWHVVFYSRVGMDRKWPWICVTIYFHLNLPLLSVLECEQAVRRPL